MFYGEWSQINCDTVVIEGKKKQPVTKDFGFLVEATANPSSSMCLRHLG